MFESNRGVHICARKILNLLAAGCSLRRLSGLDRAKLSYSEKYAGERPAVSGLSDLSVRPGRPPYVFSISSPHSLHTYMYRYIHIPYYYWSTAASAGPAAPGT